MKVLELFSGIGGMHMGLKASGVPGEIIIAVDINNIANSVYTHNFPEIEVLNRNVQSFSAKLINKLGVDTILMSPPCQPFTRNGNKKDKKDPRSQSFIHLMEILGDLNVSRILIENVKGFETSEMHDTLLRKLRKAGFSYEEYILSPDQFGVPNSRSRYYCLAKRTEKNFSCGPLKYNLPIKNEDEPFEISTILEKEANFENYMIPLPSLRRLCHVLDICYPESRRSCCFTKAYTRFLEGTGSVFTERTEDHVKEVYAKFKENATDDDELVGLKLRYFTPKEISRLMSFPKEFSFPEKVTDKQRYALLGNSVNVKVIGELIKILNE